MRHLSAAVLAGLVAVASVAFAGGAHAIDTATRLEFLNCAAGGSSDAGAGLGQTLAEGTYVMRATDEDVWVCYAATCATGGERWPVGTVMHVQVGAAGQVVSCRSAVSTGDVAFTRLRPI